MPEKRTYIKFKSKSEAFRLLSHYRENEGRLHDLVLQQNENNIEEIKKKIIALELELKRVDDALEFIPERYETILHMRYIADKDWQQIADEVHTSYRNVLTLHAKAIKKLEGIIRE
jgi:RNA polymerase sigma factor (sigma-70 family)